jgi:hypothetical protein
MFHVGQLVVKFRSARPWDADGVTAYTHIGRIYTIRGIETHPSWGDEVGLLFEEVTNSLVDGYERTYSGLNYRPVKQTSISIFTAMLSPTKADA